LERNGSGAGLGLKTAKHVNMRGTLVSMKSMKNVLRILVTLWAGVMIPVVGVAAGEPSEPTVQSIVTIKGIDYPVFGFSELKPIKQVPPKYPIWEGEKGRPGNVVVLVLVDRSGQPAEVMVR